MPLRFNMCFWNIISYPLFKNIFSCLGLAYRNQVVLGNSRHDLSNFSKNLSTISSVNGLNMKKTESLWEILYRSALLLITFHFTLGKFCWTFLMFVEASSQSSVAKSIPVILVKPICAATTNTLPLPQPRSTSESASDTWRKEVKRVSNK